MKKIFLLLVLTLTVVMITSSANLVFSDSEALQLKLTDVDSNSWAFGYITSAVKQGIFNGTSAEESDGVMKVTFSPDDYMTKEQLVVILARLKHHTIPDYDKASSFTDVDSSAWYADSVIWAELEGITNGKGDGTFGIGDYITRQEFATMLSRYINKYNVEIASFTGDPTDFTDKEKIASWAFGGVDMLREKRILLGNDKGMFLPDSNITRAEATTLIVRYCSLCSNAISCRLPVPSNIGYLVVRGAEYPALSDEYKITDKTEISRLINYISNARFSYVTEDYLRVGSTSAIALYDKDGKFVSWILNYDASTISFTATGGNIVYHYKLEDDYLKPLLDLTAK